MELLKVGRTIPEFDLPDITSGRRIAYGRFLRKRRVVLMVPNDAGRAWLAGAMKQAREFAERDLTVFVLAHTVEQADNLPEGIHILHDTDGAVSERLGGTPVFYLIGKDTGIKIASRTFPTLAELFRTIDSMPMRTQEMRAQG